MSSTSRRLDLLLTCFLCALPGSMSAAEPALPLVLERTIPLTGVSGRIDHMAVDLGRKRLLVAELGNGTIDVIDLAIMQAVHRIDGLKEPQGVGYGDLPFFPGNGWGYGERSTVATNGYPSPT